MRSLENFSPVFSRRGSTQSLFIEDLSAEELAKKFGTPLYVYSAAEIRRSYDQLKQVVSKLNATICVAIKACSNLSILELLKNVGAGFDVVSGGELKRVLEIGADPQKIVFSGVGKKDDEIRLALQAGISMLNAESLEELKVIDAIATSLGATARVSLRVNPDVDAKTHKHLSTGKGENKFGIPFEVARSIAASSVRFTKIEFVGLSCHIGSNIYDLSPYKEAFQRVRELFIELRGTLPTLHRIDLGGGIGIRYSDEEPLDLAAYADLIRTAVEGLEVSLFLEPGKFIFANSGVLLAETILFKEGEVKNFLVVDAAMNDLIRPALYEAYHEIQPVTLPGDRSEVLMDVVGPVCESGDYLGLDRRLPDIKRGEMIAIFSAGAYGISMASNYNTRGRAAEVLVCKNQATLIRRRETFEDQIALESKGIREV